MASKKINLEDAAISYMSANDIRKGSYVMLRDDSHPCKVSDYTRSKNGKHGGAKIRVVGYDVFTNKRYDDLFVSTSDVVVPVVTKSDLKLLSIDDNYCRLQLPDGTIREDIQLPNDAELATKIEELFNEGDDALDIWVTVLSAFGQEKIIGCNTTFAKEE
eukprot:TRINITY_DN21864_c0_g1_i2.p1 TRINITY_DN21864_c0_g1~~TRINITY_DN21864_c0_g1_i2.p1  ORF type:complete len:160 (-),score=37.42 TRINITY_DN21864_c0_g1_i2:47-526(-)